jgi:hypothetical protein
MTMSSLKVINTGISTTVFFTTLLEIAKNF